MTDEISAARFAALADAYGGDLGRWPAELRTAAFTIAETPEGRRLLAGAAALDVRLDRFTVPASSTMVMERVLASAPRPSSARTGLPLWRWLGFTGVGFAGAAAGALAVAALPPVPGAMLDSGYEQTAFGDVNVEGGE